MTATSRIRAARRSISMNEHWSILDTPLGPLTLVGGPAGLRAIEFPGQGRPRDEVDRDPDALTDAATQLDEYFAGERRRFELRLDLGGTPFQRRVWDELIGIPFGATRSYGTLADALGRRDIVRAVGAAVGRAPIPIVVPCHRAVGARGELTGYRGGLHRKRALLDLEAAVSGGQPPPEVWAGRQLALG
jgi:methylated-DNA-[protein]-cysteine S-methyltransferase